MFVNDLINETTLVVDPVTAFLLVMLIVVVIIFISGLKGRR